MSEDTNSTNANFEDIIRIMIATDNHLGYMEKDPIRGEDSFTAFEEILNLAESNDVDFILLGGDLFHEATPTQNTLNKCMRLLRRTTLGDRSIALEFLSDQTVHFVDQLNQTVNYEDPNLNISIPVFSIHGNHDDPSGYGRLSSLDLLSTSGLVNYFGKWTDLTQITINPILLRKGETQLALYGLSHIHDARLARLFRESKVVMEKPPDVTGDWFNLMVLHQNRAENRGATNYLPEDILPSFLNLVIWGHEHDCRIFPEESSSRKFFVSQPGSSVATSLAEGEASQKHCGILLIHKNGFQMAPIALKTVRPFVFESIVMDEYKEEYKLDEGNTEEKVVEIAKNKIEEMLKRSELQLTDDPRQPHLPLIRLRILYSSEDQMFNTIRFGQQFARKVANPGDIVKFKRQIKKIKNEPKLDTHAMEVAYEKNLNAEDDARVEDVVARYFDEMQDESKKLKVASSKILSEICYRLVDRNDLNGAESILEYYKQHAISHLLEKLPLEDNMNSEILNFKDNAQENIDKVLKMYDESGEFKKEELRDMDEIEILDETPANRSRRSNPKKPDDDFMPSKQTAIRGGRAKATRGGTAARGGRSIPAPLEVSVQPARTTSSRPKRTTKPIIYEIEDSD